MPILLENICSLKSTGLLAGALIVGLSASQAHAGPFTGATTTLFEQNFDSNTGDWFDTSGSIAQVVSGGGTLGVTSAGGAGHAEVTTGTGTGSGAFTRFGGYSSVWPGFIRQSLDVYIDPATGAIGDGWFLDNAINNTDGDWLEAGGVGAEKTANGVWSVAADGDGAGYPGGGIDITIAGWYTIVSEWVDNSGGVSIDRNTYIYDGLGNLLYSSEILNQVDFFGNGGDDLGGWRYGWIALATGGIQTIAIDNSRLDVAAIPEPGTIALLGLGFAGMGVLRRRKVNRQ